MKKNNYTYEDAWNYIITMLNGAITVTDLISISKLQDIMYKLENRIDNYN